MYLKKAGLVPLGSLLAISLAASDVRAESYVLGQNFVVTHNTEISQLGVNDGGAALTSDEVVGIFDDSTGNLVGSELVFGPGITGSQVGKTFYESVNPFVLSPGQYSIVSIGSNPSLGSDGGSGGSSLQNLGDALDLPGGSRFNSGTSLSISAFPSANNTQLSLVDPVPDGGATVVLLGGAMSAFVWLRRKI